MTAMEHIAISQLRPGSDHINARKADKKKDIESLAANIKAYGIIQPITVRIDPASEGYEIIDGNRRYTAINKLIEEGDKEIGERIPVLLLKADDADAASMTAASGECPNT